MPDVCSVDGRIEAEERAVIPALDRGFLFGDSVYEVFRTRSGTPFAWREHLERLARSATAIGLDDLPDPAATMRHVVDTLAAARDGEPTGLEHYLRLVVTRGTASSFQLDPGAVRGGPRIVVFARGLRQDRSGELSRVAMVPRRAPEGRGHDPAVKSGNYVTNMLGVARARRLGAADCVFVEADGSVSEASTANLYVVVDGQVRTPPASAGILAGVTRRLLLEAAAESGHEIVERRITADEMRAADEVFLSATLRDLAPVVEIDGRPLGTGRIGPVTARLQRAWRGTCRRRSERDALELRELLDG